jgi:hypothetical protein
MQVYYITVVFKLNLYQGYYMNINVTCVPHFEF